MRTFTWIRIRMDANFYLDPDPHGCELLPGSGSASRIWKIQFAFGSGSGMNHLLFTTLHVRTCLATVLLWNSFSRLFYIFRTGRISRMGCLMTIVMACLSIWGRYEFSVNCFDMCNHMLLLKIKATVINRWCYRLIFGNFTMRMQNSCSTQFCFHI